MRGFAMACVALLLAGCGRPADKPAEGMEGAEAKRLDLADLAGTWNVRAMTPSGDSTVVNFKMNATGSTEGWTFNFPDREPVPMRSVEVHADSVMFVVGPYESVLRKGVQVVVSNVARLENGRLVGTTVATYEGGGPDSVLHLRFEATR